MVGIVEDFGSDERWSAFDPQYIVSWCSARMSKARFKERKTLPFKDLVMRY
jgi:hypothetical protein